MIKTSACSFVSKAVKVDIVFNEINGKVNQRQVMWGGGASLQNYFIPYVYFQLNFTQEKYSLLNKIYFLIC